MNYGKINYYQIIDIFSTEFVNLQAPLICQLHLALIIIVRDISELYDCGCNERCDTW